MQQHIQKGTPYSARYTFIPGIARYKPVYVLLPLTQPTLEILTLSQTGRFVPSEGRSVRSTPSREIHSAGFWQCDSTPLAFRHLPSSGRSMALSHGRGQNSEPTGAAFINTRTLYQAALLPSLSKRSARRGESRVARAGRGLTLLETM